MSAVKENLIAARALIDTPEKWNKSGSFGNDGCWCAVGAIEMANGTWRHCMDSEEEWTALWGALPDADRNTAEPELYPIFAFNDHENTTHADILALFDRAIATCTTEQVA